MSKRPASSPPGSKQAHQPISSSHLTFGSQSGGNSAEKYDFIFFGLAAVWKGRRRRRSVCSLLTGLKACGTLPWWPIFPMRLCGHLPCMLTFPSSLPFLCLAAFLLPDFLKETASCLVPDKFSSSLIGVALRFNRTAIAQTGQSERFLAHFRRVRSRQESHHRAGRSQQHHLEPGTSNLDTVEGEQVHGHKPDNCC